MEKYYLYWIHRKCHTDILKEGYIGVTNDTKRRFRHHKYDAMKSSKFHIHRAIKKYDDIQYDIICVGRVSYIKDLEYKLRPNGNIGWNINSGGGVTELEMTEKKKQGYRNSSLKLVKVHRFDVIEMLINYYIRGYTYKTIGKEYNISGVAVAQHIQGKSPLYPELKLYRERIKKLQIWHSHRLKEMPENTYNNILNDKESGYSYLELREKYKIPESTLCKLCSGVVEFTKRFKSYRGSITKQRLIKHSGESKPVHEWSRIIGINAQTIRSRLDMGWSIEKTLTTKTRKNT